MEELFRHMYMAGNICISIGILLDGTGIYWIIYTCLHTGKERQTHTERRTHRERERAMCRYQYP